MTDCLSAALSGSHEARQKALQMLGSITKVCPQNRSLLAKIDGAVSALLNLSKSSSAIIETLSLSILFILSLNPDLKTSLADMETIFLLNSMILLPSSPESSRLAASLVCSLAMLDKNKAKFGVAGTIHLLVKSVSRHRGPAVQHLLSSLAEPVQFQGNCTVAVRCGAVPLLLQKVESNDGVDLAGTSLAVLGLLGRFDEGLNALRKTEDVVSLMLNVLKRRCMLGKEGAGEILLRLFDESEDIIRVASRALDSLTVLADLSLRGSAKAREKATLLMKKMIEANVDSDVDGESMYFHWQ